MYGMGSVWARYCLGFDSVLPSHRACPGLRGAAARQERGRDGRRADVRRDAPAASWRRGAPRDRWRTHARPLRAGARIAPSSRYELVRDRPLLEVRVGVRDPLRHDDGLHDRGLVRARRGHIRHGLCRSDPRVRAILGLGKDPKAMLRGCTHGTQSGGSFGTAGHRRFPCLSSRARAHVPFISYQLPQLGGFSNELGSACVMGLSLVRRYRISFGVLGSACLVRLSPCEGTAWTTSFSPRSRTASSTRPAAGSLDLPL
jgi:hypothetical protein